MDVVRKSIAVLIIILIAGPVLFGVIWAVGVTRAVVSPEFLSDLPREIIEKVPAMVDDILVEVNKEDMVKDPNERAWVKAVANAETSPKELLAKIGIMDWMQNELSVKFVEMGKMLRGEIPLQPIKIDLRPLKVGLRDQAIKDYLVEIMKNLPACDSSQNEEWTTAGANPRPLEELPACRPTEMAPENYTKAIDFVREHEIEEIPDEVNIFKSNPRFHKGVDFIHSIISFTYLLFLIPAVFIVVAALIGGSGKNSFLRWMAVPTFIAGAMAFATSSLIKHALPWSMAFGPETRLHMHSHSITQFEQLIFTKVGDIGGLVVNQILKGVNSTAGMVCVVAIILYALSFLIGEDSKPKQTPQRRKTDHPEPPTPEKTEEQH